MGVCVCVRVCARVCVSACVRACVRACVCVCVFTRAGQHSTNTIFLFDDKNANYFMTYLCVFFSFKYRLKLTHMYSCFRVQALHIHILTLESNYTAHLSDQNSPSTGPESHTALTTLKTVLSLSTDVVLAKWSLTTFAS